LPPEQIVDIVDAEKF